MAAGHRSTARWVPHLEAAIGGLAIATTVAVGAGGSDAAVPCSSFPSCLGTGTTVLSALHVGGAAALLLLTAAVVLWTRPRRTGDRGLFGLAIAQLVVLLLMASLGAAFAAGELARTWAPVQYGVVAGFLTLAVVVAVRALHNGRAEFDAPSHVVAGTGR